MPKAITTPSWRYLVRLMLIQTVFALGVPDRAVAKEDTDQRARDAFAQGVEAFQAGDYNGALNHFQNAERAQSAAVISYNVARTYEKLGRPHEAIAAYEKYLTSVGQSGEFTEAAVIAIAEIKANSTKLRIESTPPGAKITIDGRALSESTPASILLPAGKHIVAVELDSWVDTRQIEALGQGDTTSLVFVRSQAAAPKPQIVVVEPASAAASAPEPPKLEGLTGTLGLSLTVYRFAGEASETSGTETTAADSTPDGFAFGLAFDVGYALGSRLSLLLRGISGLGSSEKALASLGAAGPVVAWRASESFWIGGGLILGSSRADSEATTESEDDARNSSITFQTGFALGPSLEVGFVMDASATGHWLVSLLPSALFTASGEQSTVFVPLLFGHRWL